MVTANHLLNGHVSYSNYVYLFYGDHGWSKQGDFFRKTVFNVSPQFLNIFAVGRLFVVQ